MADILDVAPQGRKAWRPSPEAVALVESIYYKDLPSLDLEGLANWLTRRREGASRGENDHRSVFSDALYDLSCLLQEVRFEAALAAAYIIDLKDHLALAMEPGEPFRGVGIPSEVLALLSPYLAQNPSPIALFTDPAKAIAGHRLLGGWHAGQLLDSALIRALAALDRLAILLWCAADQPLSRDKTGDLHLPAFRHGYLRKMSPSYENHEAWSVLLALVDHGFMKLIKPYRDGFVHRRRRPMHLHGEYLTVANPPGVGTPTRGFTASDHLALVLGFYSEVLRPAVASTSKLLYA